MIKIYYLRKKSLNWNSFLGFFANFALFFLRQMYVLENPLLIQFKNKFFNYKRPAECRYIRTLIQKKKNSRISLLQKIFLQNIVTVTLSATPSGKLDPDFS